MAVVSALATSDGLASEVRRNSFLLGTCLTLSWAVIQLQSVLGTVTFAELSGLDTLAGLSTAVFLAGLAIATLPTGRLMDARGRRAGLGAGFGTGIIGALVTFAGVQGRLTIVFLLGIALVGAAVGGIGLARAGAADMYPAARRARGISLVLLGAAAGAILGPIAFAPFLRDVRTDPRTLAGPWLGAAALFALGLVVVRLIRVDPIEIGRRLASFAPRALPELVASGVSLDALAEAEVVTGPGPFAAAASVGDAAESETGRPVRGVIASAPEIPVAFLVAIVAQSVMTASMSVIGLHLVRHGHDLASVSVALSGHFLGMFGLVLVAGQVVDRLGRQRSMALGLLILAAGSLGLVASESLLTIVPAMFAIGVGWNLGYVAATTTLADVSRPTERGRVLAAMDFASIGMAAIGSILATAILGQLGLQAVVAFSIVAALVPVPLLWTAGSGGLFGRAGAAP